MKVYLVGRWIGNGTLWGIQGIFSQEYRAVEACRDDACFWLPFELDQEAETLEQEVAQPRYPALEDPFTTPITEPTQLADRIEQDLFRPMAESLRATPQESTP